MSSGTQRRGRQDASPGPDTEACAAADAIVQQLNRVLASSGFARSGRLSRFLSFIVGESLGGRADRLKEYFIGLKVFDRDQSFDPRLDPIVRVEAGRLRAKLTRYYETEGRGDPVIIELARGSYAPVFRPLALSALPPEPAGPNLPPRRTIAVLPFADQSPGGNQEYFCDGLTEELINALTNVEALRVAAWGSMAQLKGEDWDPREIGARLNVGVVLQGSVRKEGDRLRVTAHLIDVPTGSYLWSDSYDQEFKNVFAIQENISRAIVQTLKIRLTGRTDRPLVKRYTEDSAAYKLYLKGRYHWNKRSKDGLWEGLRYFEKALEIDPNYSLAYAGLADSYSLLGNYGVLPSHTVRTKAQEAALKAVDLDPALAESHASLGHVAATYEWDWDLAEREFEMAIQLNAAYATAHHWYAITCLMPLRRLEEALLEIEQAQQLDPVSASIARDSGIVSYCRREYETAAAQAARTLELDPGFYEGYWLLGLACEQQHRLEESYDALRRGLAMSKSPRLLGAFGHCCALCGRKQEAEQALAELAALAERRYVSPFDFAIIHIGMRDTEGAFEWLQRALALRCYEMVWLKVDPRLDSLRLDRRFTSLLSAIGLEQRTFSGLA